MPIFEIKANEIYRLNQTTFAQQGIKERQDLQRLLRTQVDIISPDTLVISEEFGEWEESRRRIDLLAIDKEANIVVIELKRTEDGAHMELQALRYASMVTNLTFKRAVEIYASHLNQLGLGIDAETDILKFLEWDEPDEESFGQDVRIVLASSDFSKELTSSVLWLNDKGLDIRCVRMKPYEDGNRTLLDVQTIIPLPETEQYQIKLKEKQREEWASRSQNRDTSKYDLSINGETYMQLNKRNLVFRMVKTLIDSGASPEDVAKLVPWRENRMFVVKEGEINFEDFQDWLMESDSGGRVPRKKRFFSKEGELFYCNGKTYALSNQWGTQTLEAVENMIKAYPNLNCELIL